MQAVEERVLARMPFVDPEGGPPVKYFEHPERNTGRYIPVEVPVINGRSAPATSLAREGFELLQAPSAVRDFYDEDAVRGTYYAEASALVKQATGANRVFVYEHLIRCDAVGEKNGVAVRGASTFMHVDFAPGAAAERVRGLLPAAEAERLLAHRFMQVNVWRPITGPLRTMPLAICDSTSIAPADFVRAVIHSEITTNEFYVVRHDPAQRWHYYPDMMPGEAILIRNHDSALPPLQLTAHGAIQDAPPGALPRESIEARCLAFFAPD